MKIIKIFPSSSVAGAASQRLKFAPRVILSARSRAFKTPSGVWNEATSDSKFSESANCEVEMRHPWQKRMGLLTLLIVFLCLTPSAQGQEKSIPDNRLRQTPLEHFTLFSEFEISKDDLLSVRRHLTNARRLIGRDLLMFPEYKFEVLLVTKETFESYSDLPSHVVGFFDGRIHLPLPSEVNDDLYLKKILWHEYTHAVIWEMMKGACPYWLNEGLAVYQEAKIDPHQMRYLPEAMKEGRLPIPLKDIDKVLLDVRLRDPKMTRVAYEQAYGFVNYLFSRYNRRVIHAFLESLKEDRSFLRASREKLHLTEDEVENRWTEHILKML
jgi:hypothetical protein